MYTPIANNSEVWVIKKLHNGHQRYNWCAGKTVFRHKWSKHKYYIHENKNQTDKKTVSGPCRK